MRIDEAIVGTRVKSLVDFSGVPKGTEGVIDEDYVTGVMVAWDLPDQPLPPIRYSSRTGKMTFFPSILRDGFDKNNELHFLEKI